MEDSRIVALYWSRDEHAIVETKIKYGRYCYAIAYNILSNHEEAEESENDTYLEAWNSMPPHRPDFLSAFLAKITRRISLDRFRRNTAVKRGSGQIMLSLDELCVCIPDHRKVEDYLQAAALSKHIDTFLRTLPQEERNIFLCRYWYLDSIAQIARRFVCTQSRVKTMLYRTRQKLRKYLEEEGICV